jgi:hypothetical protein
MEPIQKNPIFYKQGAPNGASIKMVSCPEMSLHKSKRNGKDNYRWKASLST